MNYAILFRRGTDLQHEDEFNIAKQYFNVIEYRSHCPLYTTVIGRYSVLPFFRELEEDLKSLGCRLIDGWAQHSWIANFDYYEDLKEFTAETWTDYNFYQCKDSGPFVVKGRTNSRKQHWDTLMFAETKQKALEIAQVLASDNLIGPQGVIYRKYIPLVTYEIGINNVRYTNEWRIFYYKNKRLSHGYYWSTASCPEKAHIDESALEFADSIANIAKDHVNFFVLDIAEKESGGWILVEVNSGTQSGLSENNPHVLYKNLLAALEE